MKDPHSLEPLLVPGGIIESLSVVVLVLASILSLVVALRLRQRKEGCQGWIFYSVLCFFLAGEEAAWGDESIFGWQALTSPLPDDLHNWITDVLVPNLRTLGVNDLFGITLLVVCVTVAFVAPLFVIFKKRGQNTRTLYWVIWNHLPKVFFALGLVLIILGNFFDFLWEIDLPYFRGRWVLEESLELLGSVALLFGVLLRIHEEVQSSRKRQKRDIKG
ncbi:MAG: hypothetical protein ACE5E2_06025 [Candidatus Binatia bacterium]